MFVHTPRPHFPGQNHHETSVFSLHLNPFPALDKRELSKKSSLACVRTPEKGVFLIQRKSFQSGNETLLPISLLQSVPDAGQPGRGPARTWARPRLTTCLSISAREIMCGHGNSAIGGKFAMTWRFYVTKPSKSKQEDFLPLSRSLIAQLFRNL